MGAKTKYEKSVCITRCILHPAVHHSIHRPICLTEEGSVHLPLGLGTYCTQAGSFSGLKVTTYRALVNSFSGLKVVTYCTLVDSSGGSKSRISICKDSCQGVVIGCGLT